MVDESYYEVQWTYGQKLEYKNLGQFKKEHLEIPWIVATATAGSDVDKNITYLFKKCILIIKIIYVNT